MYTPDETVIHSTILLLAAGAAFQLFDGIQTVATGALRGAAIRARHVLPLHRVLDYWSSARCLAVLPSRLGAFGLWAGLSLALILIGIVLLFAWRRTVRG